MQLKKKNTEIAMSKRKTQKTIQYGDITYTLSLRKLGSGGNGAVYVFGQYSLNIIIAMKRIKL